jgi:hypothetical protein
MAGRFQSLRVQAEIADFQVLHDREIGKGLALGHRRSPLTLDSLPGDPWFRKDLPFPGRKGQEGFQEGRLPGPVVADGPTTSLSSRRRNSWRTACCDRLLNILKNHVVSCSRRALELK